MSMSSFSSLDVQFNPIPAAQSDPAPGYLRKSSRLTLVPGNATHLLARLALSQERRWGGGAWPRKDRVSIVNVSPEGREARRKHNHDRHRSLVRLRVSRPGVLKSYNEDIQYSSGRASKGEK